MSLFIISLNNEEIKGIKWKWSMKSEIMDNEVVRLMGVEVWVKIASVNIC